MSEINTPNGLMYSIAAYRSNDSEENLGSMYQELIDSTFIVPVIITPKPVEGEEINLTKDTRFNFYVMKNKDGARYLLIFSCLQSIKDWANTNKPDTVNLAFKDIVNILKKDESIQGILVDPMDGNMVFERELMFTLFEIDNEATELH